ncbi:UNVERIFIED_CONTAM: hypothetical protein Sradi_6134600 [Sesamum radiatum]|uniref:Uncharacterized protein n=1 Tax=Sesamum radiatum TaxID=300843 RepID=A0AAW2KL34_SESRA
MVLLQVFASLDPNNEVSTFLPIAFVVLSSFDWPENLCPLVEYYRIWACKFLPSGCALSALPFPANLLHTAPFQARLTSPFGAEHFSRLLKLLGASPSACKHHGQGKKSRTPAATTGSTGQAAGQQATAPTAVTAVADTKDNTKATSSEFQAFISDLEASLPFNPLNYASADHGSNTSGRQEVELLLGKGEKTGATVSAKPSFAGLFSTNRKLTMDNKLSKFKIEDGTITLESDDLTDVRAKLGFCIVATLPTSSPACKLFARCPNLGELRFNNITAADLCSDLQEMMTVNASLPEVHIFITVDRSFSKRCRITLSSRRMISV